MTLDQIRYFCAAAQLGSFSKAAEASHVSQPCLSISIKKLEAELQVKLFHPERRGTVLTDVGHVFLQDCQNILDQVDVAIMHMSQFAQQDKAEIRLAYTASVSDVFIPRLLKSFLETEGKGYRIYSDEMSTAQIQEGIRDGKFDLGIGSSISPDPDIEQIPFLHQDFCLLLPKNEDPEKYKSVTALNHVPFISYRQDFMYQILNQLFTKWRVTPHIMHYSHSEISIAHLVEQNLGIAIIAEIEGLSEFDVQILHPEWLKKRRNIYLLRHRTRLLSDAAQKLMNRVLALSTIE